MKKVLVLSMLFVLIGTSAFAWTCKSSGLLTASGVVSVKATTICGIVCIADGTNAATCSLRDSVSSASGNYLWKNVVAAGEYYGGGMFPNLIQAYDGAYITLSGTGANAIIFFDAQ